MQPSATDHGDHWPLAQVSDHFFKIIIYLFIGRLNLPGPRRILSRHAHYRYDTVVIIPDHTWPVVTAFAYTCPRVTGTYILLGAVLLCVTTGVSV